MFALSILIYCYHVAGLILNIEGLLRFMHAVCKNVYFFEARQDFHSSTVSSQKPLQY